MSGAGDTPLANVYCHNCQESIPGLRVLCAVCPDLELCISCFSCGAEIGPHKRDHAYRLADRGSFSIFQQTGSRPWQASKELELVEAVEHFGYVVALLVLLLLVVLLGLVNVDSGVSMDSSAYDDDPCRIEIVDGHSSLIRFTFGIVDLVTGKTWPSRRTPALPRWKSITALITSTVIWAALRCPKSPIPNFKRKIIRVPKEVLFPHLSWCNSLPSSSRKTSSNCWAICR